MKKPNIENYNPSPDYLRDLIAKVRSPELINDKGRPAAGAESSQAPSQRHIARRLGIPERTFRAYLSDGNSHQDAPYVVQYALECLAAD